jgi:hypothetical protein
VLQEQGLLLGVKKSNSASAGWGDNPKNTLVTSVAFRDVCCGGNARALPITLRSSGPDHAKVCCLSYDFSVFSVIRKVLYFVKKHRSS